MISFVLMLKRKPGFSKEQFREHYETSHVALARKYVGHLFEDYKRNYVNSSSLVSAEGYSVDETDSTICDVVTIITFKDQAKLDEFFGILNQPDVKAAFQADEERFIDRSAMRMSLCDEVKTWDGAELRSGASSNR